MLSFFGEYMGNKWYISVYDIYVACYKFHWRIVIYGQFK